MEKLKRKEKRIMEMTKNSMMRLVVCAAVIIWILVIRASVVEAATLAELRDKYPTGYTFGVDQDISGPVMGWTGKQCHGFALLLGYELTGKSPEAQWGERAYNLDSLKAGDIVRFNGTGHTILITSVSGSKVTYVDCNWEYHDTIPCYVCWHDTPKDKSELTATFGALGYRLVCPIDAGNTVIKFWGSISNTTEISTTTKIWAKRYDKDSNHHAQFFIDDVAITGYLKADESDLFSVEINPDKYSVGNHTIKVKYSNTSSSWTVSKTLSFKNTDKTVPEIKNIQITDLSSKGYTVTFTVTDNAALNYVKIHTWTEKDNQDDIKTEIITPNETSVAYRVNTFDHNNEYGNYVTHIYAWDKAGNQTSDSVGRTVITVPSGIVPVNVGIYNNHIYAYFSDCYTWKEAKSLCETMGGHLATITTEAENNYVHELVGENYAFIGCTDEQKEGTWKWITGESFSYAPWHDGEPNNANSAEHYGEIRPNAKWNDNKNAGDFHTGFVLEIEKALTPVNKVTSGSYVYQAYDVSMPWEVAQAYCEFYNGSLAVPVNDSENTVIKNLIQNGSKDYYFLGITDKAKESTWVDTKGNAVSYVNWASGEPNNSNEEDYVHMGKNGQWNDTRSYRDYNGFILKRAVTQDECTHNYSSTVTKAATCTEKGIRKYTCKNCGKTYDEEIAKIAHTVVTDQAVAATCTHTGKTEGSHCSVCGTVIKAQQEISATGHNYTATYTWSDDGTRCAIQLQCQNQANHVVSVPESSTTVKVLSETNSDITYQVSYSYGAKTFTDTKKVAKTAVALSVTASADRSSATVGNKVTFTAAANGGSGSYKYSLIVYNRTTGQWGRVFDNVANASFTWTAGSAGNRDFYIDVKDSMGKIVRSKAVNVNVTLGAGQLRVSAVADKSSTLVGEKVRFISTAAGGSGSYRYSLIVHNKTTNQWARIADNVEDPSFTWTAGSIGNREFFIDVKDSTGKVVRSTAINVETTANTGAFRVSAVANKSNAAVGEVITFTAAANGGSGSCRYSLIVYNRTTNQWARIADNVANANFTWTAGSAGNREFYIDVKDSMGKIVRSAAINVVTN